MHGHELNNVCVWVDRRICLCYNASCCTVPTWLASLLISTSCITITRCLTSAHRSRSPTSSSSSSPADLRVTTAPSLTTLLPRPRPPVSPQSAPANASRRLTTGIYKPLLPGGKCSSCDGRGSAHVYNATYNGRGGCSKARSALTTALFKKKEKTSENKIK